VLSRLNAQFIFMPSVSGIDVCEYLASVTTLPPSTRAPVRGSSNGCSSRRSRSVNTPMGSKDNSSNSVNSCGSSGGAGEDGSGGGEDEGEDEEFRSISADFFDEFNRQVQHLFGKTMRLRKRKFDGDTADNTAATAASLNRADAEGDADAQGAVCGGGAECFVPGALFSYVTMHREWGRGLEYVPKHYCICVCVVYILVCSVGCSVHLLCLLFLQCLPFTVAVPGSGRFFSAVALKLVSLLRADSPFITPDLFVAALTSMVLLARV
jgi:hypothetical protein